MFNQPTVKAEFLFFYHIVFLVNTTYPHIDHGRQSLCHSSGHRLGAQPAGDSLPLCGCGNAALVPVQLPASQAWGEQRLSAQGRVHQWRVWWEDLPRHPVPPERHLGTVVEVHTGAQRVTLVQTARYVLLFKVLVTSLHLFLTTLLFVICNIPHYLLDCYVLS